MKYNELPKRGTDLQLQCSCTTELWPSRRQAQAPGGEPGALQPNLLFEFNCVRPGFVLSSFCCYSHLLKEAGLMHLNYCETEILEHKRHH